MIGYTCHWNLCTTCEHLRLFVLELLAVTGVDRQTDRQEATFLTLWDSGIVSCIRASW